MDWTIGLLDYWTVGPLDQFLDYFLDQFLDHFLDHFFLPILILKSSCYILRQAYSYISRRGVVGTVIREG